MGEPSRFEGLKKFPAEPVAAILGRARVKLRTPLEAGPKAGVSEVLAELDAKGAVLDILQLIAHALPAREATWWACLAARDLLPPDAAEPPAPLATAEAWVFKPGDETRRKARAAMEGAALDDDTVFCAMAATFADGTLGPDQLSDFAAPPGVVGNAVYGMVLKSLYSDGENSEAQGRLLVARGLDIARGGSGRVVAKDATSGAAARGGA